MEQQTLGGVTMSILEQKQQVVSDIAAKLRDSKSTVVVDYRGLNVAEVTELRKQLREAGIEFKVYKNTLTRRATEATELTDLDSHLVGPTAIAFGADDVIAPAKIINEYNLEIELTPYFSCARVKMYVCTSKLGVVVDQGGTLNAPLW